MPKAAESSSAFASRLAFALKATNLSRAQLASAVEVDKSLVSRWLSGQVVPTSHNLARISDTLAKVRQGFNTVLWERSEDEFAAFFGLAKSTGIGEAPPAAASDAGALGFPPQLVETARRETALRGVSFEAFWTITRVASTDPNWWLREPLLIRRRDGLLQVRGASGGVEISGWLFLAQNNHYVIAREAYMGTMGFMMLNDVVHPRVVTMDGIMMMIGFGAGRAVNAMPIVIVREAELSGDDAADDLRFEELKARKAATDAKDIPENIRAHLTREIGPQAFASGGDFFLRSPIARSIGFGSREDPAA